MDEWLLIQDGYYMYVLLFLLLMGGAVGLPIPEDLVLILGGILAHRGNGSPQAIFITCYAGIVLGDMLIYFVGRSFGPALFKTRWFRSKVSHSQIRQARLRLERRSLLMIFVARHLFYLRMVTFLTCGAVRMKFVRFLFADATAALISAPIMLGLGYMFSEQYDQLVHLIDQARFWIIVVSLVLVAAYLLRRRKLRHDKNEQSNPRTPPAAGKPGESKGIQPRVIAKPLKIASSEHIKQSP